MPLIDYTTALPANMRRTVTVQQAASLAYAFVTLAPVQLCLPLVPTVCPAASLYICLSNALLPVLVQCTAYHVQRARGRAEGPSQGTDHAYVLSQGETNRTHVMRVLAIPPHMHSAQRAACQGTC